VEKVVEKAKNLTVGTGPSADIGPITMPSQINVIRRHIDDAIARGGRAVLGGPESVQPPLVLPTVLVDVPEDSAAIQEETFGPTLTVTKVATAEDGVRLSNASRYGLGGSVFGKARAMALARAMRSGMVSVNSTLTFAGFPSLPFGGVGDSGFGRIHGDDGLREMSRAKAITRRRMRSAVPTMSYSRKPRHVKILERALRIMNR
jgi:acyl-CoA reductase-like NAD-dependent aldehyde dehydrogenase